MGDFDNKFVNGKSLARFANKTKEYIDDTVSNIASTYITDVDFTGDSISYKKGDGTIQVYTSSSLKWGNSRSITIGNTAKNVDGSANVSWSLSEIGAAKADHGTHLTIGTGASNAAAGNHTHTTLTGITSLTFVSDTFDSSDKASLAVAPSATGTYFDFNLADDPGQEDMWRWRFTPSGGTVFNVMKLDPTSTTEGKLTVEGNITAKSFTENGTALSSKYAAASHGTHLTLGTSSSNAYRGDYGNTAYTHSQAAHAPSNAQKNSDITKTEIENKLTGLVGSHEHDYTIVKSPNNTVTSTSNDTVSNWGYHCNSVHWFTQNNCLIDQPNQWGFLQNYSTGGTEVHQLWFTQASGSIYHRGGNASGWNGSWREILDSSNYTNHIPKSSLSKYTNTYAWTNNDGITYLGSSIQFVDGVTDQYGQTCSIYGINNSNVHNLSLSCWGHWKSADIMASWDLGAEGWEWGTGYIFYGIVEGSDRNSKENINYIRNNEINILSLEDESGEDIQNNFTYSDLYNFVKDDLELATFNFIEQEQDKLGFIAQDLLYNLDGTDNKIGQFIVPPVAALTDEEVEEKKAEFEVRNNRQPTDEELEVLSTPKLKYDQSNYISTLAGALKEAIGKIESQQEMIDNLISRIEELERNN